MEVTLKLLWKHCREVLVGFGIVNPLPTPEGSGEMQEDLQIVWKNPSPPPRQKASVSKGMAGDRLAVYPSGRQVWFEDVSGGLTLSDSQSAPRILPEDDSKP